MGYPTLNLPVQDMVREYQAGHSLADIAERYEVSIITARKRLLAGGATMRPKGYRRIQKHEKFDTLMREVMNSHHDGQGWDAALQQVAERHGWKFRYFIHQPRVKATFE